MSVQLREVLKVFQSCHNLNHTTKQPVVMSPAVQFHPVPLVKRMPVREPGEQIQQAVTLQWICPSSPQSSVAHTYTKGPRGKRDNEALHINDASSPLSIFLLYFAEIITVLLVETNCYCHVYIDLTMDPFLNVTLLKLKCLCFWH